MLLLLRLGLWLVALPALGASVVAERRPPSEPAPDVPIERPGRMTTTKGHAIGGTLDRADPAGAAVRVGVVGPPRGSNVGTVTVTIAAVNDPPVAQTGLVTTTAGMAIEGLLRASDPDHETLTFRIVEAPKLGAVSVDAATGAFRYEPAPGASGADAFTFQVEDAAGAISTASEQVIIVSGAPQWPGQTVRASVASGGRQGNRESGGPALSADGRYVAFASLASNLVDGDTNGTWDVFVHDRQTGQTSRVSVGPQGEQGNGWSGQPAVSADGRFVAFASLASNLVAGDTNGTWDIFVHDLASGQTERVSVASDGTEAEPGTFSEGPAISAEGRYVAFTSTAATLVAGDANGVDDVFVHDRVTRTTSRVSVGRDGAEADGWSYQAALSADGRLVGFTSVASNLVPGDSNGIDDVFVHDRQTGETRRVSVSPDGSDANDWSDDPTLSADGRYVGFVSQATNLVTGDGNGLADVFVYDTQSGVVSRVGIATGGGEANGWSDQPALSADGRYVAFFSAASNLTSGTNRGAWDVFAHDRQTGETRRVSVSGAGTPANWWSDQPALSGDGRFVAFRSAGSNLVADDVNGRSDVFVVGGVSVAPADQSFAARGGIGQVTTTFVYPGTGWQAVSHAPWITIAGQSSTQDSGSVDYNVASNPGGARTGTLTVAAQTITIAQGENHAPQAEDGRIGTSKNVPMGGQLTAIDPDGDSLTYSIVRNGTLGTATMTDGSGGTFTYTPHLDSFGIDTFTFKASDGIAESAVATITVDIAGPVNRNPMANPDSVTTTVNSAVTIDVLANDTDPDGDALTIASITQPANGAAVIQGGSVGFAPSAGFTGATSFSYTISDGNGGTATALVSVTVAGTPGEFTFTLASTEASGFAGSRVLVPFRVVRAPGTTEDITVTVAGAPEGIAAVDAIIPDGVSDGLLDVAIGRDLAPGSVLLQLAAASTSVSRSASLALQVAAPSSSSIELIRAGILAGVLDRPTSLLYRAYALIGDARLPAAYRGSGSVDEDPGLFTEIRELMPTLTPVMRAELQPFVLRPSNPDSWYGQLLASLAPAAAATSNGMRARASLLNTPTTLAAGDPVLPSTCDDDPAAPLRWISTRSAENGFRVWAHCVAGAPRAAEKVVAKAVAVFDVLWGPMSGDMGPPLPDVKAGTPINPADGVGDETIDIYLLFPGDVVTRLGSSYRGAAHAVGWARPWNDSGDSGCPEVGRSSGFISIPVTTLLAASFHMTAAHELFHVLQYGHNCQLDAVASGFGGFENAPRRRWWYVEASATWAEAHYDRALAGPLGRGRWALDEVYDPWFAARFQARGSTLSLNAGGSPGAPGGDRPYEAFIWPYFLEQESGDPSRPAGQMWAAVTGATTPDAADARIDAVVPFATNMRKFAVRNLNNVAVGNRYESLDPGQFPKDTPPNPVYSSHFRAGQPQTIDFSLTTLAAYYIRLDNDVEPNLRKVSVDFTGLDYARADLGIDVDLVLKLKGGNWQAARDFNGTKKKTWCLDEDKVESMYLVISAHELKEAGVITRDVSIAYSASVAPCRPTWVGTARLSSTQRADLVSMASADGVTFELLGESPNLQVFGLVPGGIARMEQMIIECERSPQPPSVPITAANTLGSLAITYSSDGSKMTVTGIGGTFYTGSIIVDCSTGERFDQASISASWLSFGNGITVPVDPAPAQQRIQGSFNVSVVSFTNSILTVDLRLVRQ